MKEISSLAKAYATSANQPAFDAGGFPIKPIEVVAGKPEFWETLFDEVSIEFTPGKESEFIIENIVKEQNVPTLPTQMKENTAGVAILAFMNKTKLDLNGEFRITIKKGLSIKGTGLGSSGASAAAGLKAIENLFEKLSIPNNLSNKDKSNILKTADFGVPDNAIPSYFGGLNIIDPKGSRKITSKHKFLFVLTTPKDFGIPTALAREALKGKSAPNDSEIIIQKAIEAFEEGTVFEYAANIEKLHDWFVVPRKKLYPDKIYDKVYATAKNSGSLATTISGAGPTILSIVDNMEVGRKVAQMKYNEFKKNGFDSVSRIVTVDYNGAS